MGGCAEEGNPRLVHCVRSDGLVVTDDEFLCAGWRYRREAWNAGTAAGQRAQNCRVVKVIVEGPIARLLTIKVDPLSDFVVCNPVLLTIVRKCAVGVIGTGDVWENSNRRRRPRCLGNYSAWKDAVRRRVTAWKTVLLTACDRVTQSIGKRRGPVEAGRGRRRTITGGGKGGAIDCAGQS